MLSPLGECTIDLAYKSGKVIECERLVERSTTGSAPRLGVQEKREKVKKYGRFPSFRSTAPFRGEEVPKLELSTMSMSSEGRKVKLLLSRRLFGEINPAGQSIFDMYFFAGSLKPKLIRASRPSAACALFKTIRISEAATSNTGGGRSEEGSLKELSAYLIVSLHINPK